MDVVTINIEDINNIETLKERIVSLEKELAEAEETIKDYKAGLELGEYAFKELAVIFRVNMLKAYPTKTHKEISREVNRILAFNEKYKI